LADLVTVLNLFDEAVDNGGKRLVCKFALVRLEDRVSLVFGPISEYPYHASLVEEFCRANMVSSGWERKPDLYGVYDPRCRVLGGGYLELAGSRSAVRFGGASTAYGTYDEEDLRLVVENAAYFVEFEVTIE